MLAATGQREVTRAWRHEARAVQLGIPEAAQRLRARLMVLSPHGRADLAQLPIASVTEALLHSSPPGVLPIPPDGRSGQAVVPGAPRVGAPSGAVLAASGDPTSETSGPWAGQAAARHYSGRVALRLTSRSTTLVRALATPGTRNRNSSRNRL
ncbi:hypothetical protein [Rhodosalinus sp.]|uniref:hypothetical protein n=1 Tax=Rhodosalinus sp. TaxID=2047741 RepID=UPI00397BC8AC